MARGGSYVYDPRTGKWTKKQNTKPVHSKTPSKGKPSKGSPTKKRPSKREGTHNNLKTTNPSKHTSTGAVEKKYNEIEVNTLEATLEFVANENTITLRAGNTVKLVGLGKYLSGNYYIKEIERQINASNGYTHKAVVIKPDFGSTLKTKTKSSKKKGSSSSKKKPKKKKETTKKVSSSRKSSNAKRTYTVKRGDCLWGIAKKYYGNGALYKKIYKANSKKISNPNVLKIGQVLIIP